MNHWALILHEAKLEIRAGFKSGIVALAFWGLVLYLLLCLVNADYMQQMGATDVPRNSPLLIYLMGAGCMFFQFFAWAWVYSQPILRDRKADLHEIYFTTPTSLNVLLWGRFLGASVIGAILSASALVGIVVSPALVWTGLIPESAIGPMPWQALTFAWFWLQIPAAVGIGALYFMITLRTRNLAGPFGVAAAIMMLWMFAVIVLRGGSINPVLAAVIDPSLFTFVYTEVNTWTPLEKSTALLPFTTGSVLNRVVWFVLPLLMLFFVLRTITRESLVLEAASKPATKDKKGKKEAKTANAVSTSLAELGGKAKAAPASIGRNLQQLGLETRWRLFHILRSRAWWIGAGILVMMGVVSSFTQIIWHSEGPMAPRLEMLLPLLKDAVFLVIAFVIAALIGLVCRRDHITGFDDMLSATPIPDYLPIFGQALTVLAMTILLALLPGISGLLAILMTSPQALDVGLAFSYQLLIVAAPLVELSMMVLLVHAIFRHAGLAYSMSMLVTFFLVLNHELELVHYPPFEMGITAHIKLSALSGWTPWLDYLLALDSFKLALATLMAGLAALLIPRGLDSRVANGFAQLRSRLAAPQGGVLVGACVVLMMLSGVLEQKLVEQGGYESPEQAKQIDAEWEKYWLAKIEREVTVDTKGNQVEGGQLTLNMNPELKRIEGLWQLNNVQVVNGLHFELPLGVEVNNAQVNNQFVQVEQRFDHLFIPVSNCASQGCTVTFDWVKQITGWSAEGEPLGIGPEGIWLQAADIVPSLGFDPERILRVPAEREALGLAADFAVHSGAKTRHVMSLEAVAPAGNWQWQVNLVAEGQSPEQFNTIERGQTLGALDFAVIWGSSFDTSEHAGLQISHDSARSNMVSAVGEDVSKMQACVNQKLGSQINVQQVAQWPRGLGETRFSGKLLQLAEGPHWDVTDKGTGRWLRQVDIARALARHYFIEQTDLRRMAGNAWLGDGVAGAIGLSCLGASEGLAALEQVLVRYADKTTRDLAGSKVPVTTLAEAPLDGWSRYYAPVAALDWTLSQTPASFKALLANIQTSNHIEKALTTQVGGQKAAEMLGEPLSTQLTTEQAESGQLLLSSQRFRWQQGGWQVLNQESRYRLLTEGAMSKNQLNSFSVFEGKIGLDQLPADNVLVLDMWAAYLRDPSQHVLHKTDNNKTF